MFKKVIGQNSQAPKSSQQASQAELPKASYPAQDLAPKPQAPSPVHDSSQASSGAMTRNVLSSDVEIKGTLKFEHDLIVDGKIEGDIQSKGSLTVGENARLKAEVKTGTVIVYGKIHGNITAVDRVDLKSGAEVLGDIKAKILMMEAGATFVGKSTVGTASNPSSAASSKPPVSNVQQPAAPVAATAKPTKPARQAQL